MPGPNLLPVDVPLSTFLGLNTEVAPPDCPEGVSPDNADVAYIPGNVFSRPGLHKIFNPAFPGFPSVTYLKTYIQPNEQPINLYQTSDGVLWQEDPINTPGMFTKISQLIPGAYIKSVTAFGREYIAQSDGKHGLGVPLQFDGTNLDRVSQDGPGAAVTVVDSGAAGNISAGSHNCVVMFLTRQGALTAPSPPFTWNAAGSKKAAVSNLPIGPANVVARVLAFTGSGGDNYFTILQTLTTPSGSGGAPIVTAALVIPDNTSSTATVDFSDNALFAGNGIDIPGNNLFAQVVLGPVLGFFSYASRLAAWGEYNKVQNFLNMGFEGGFLSGAPTLPLGWDTSANAGGALVATGAWTASRAWVVTGDGSANAKGKISQSAYQDLNGITILQALKTYNLRVWLSRSLASTAGSVVVDVFSAGSGGVLATASVALTSVLQNAGQFFQASFSAALPATIPADTVIRVYTLNTANTQQVIIDELEIIYQAQPYLDSTFRFSYVNNPEAFDGVTGNLGPADDPHPLRGPFEIRNTMYILTSKRLHSTSDNGNGEPGTWNVPEVANNCGALSSFGITSHRDETGEDWAVWASDSGARIFGGAEPSKISQEIQTEWDQINRNAKQSIWVVNDTTARRIYFGLPLGQSTAPNRIYPLDYRELESEGQISGSGSIHISFTGKMIASDLARKWTRWNIAANAGAILTRASGPQFCVGGGNGVTPGQMNSFGNVYFLDPLKLTDDDYGAIVPYYTLYAFVNHEMEQALGCGSHRKLYKSASLFVSGVGYLILTPLADSLSNPQLQSLPQPLALPSNLTGTGYGIGGYGLGGYGGVPGPPGTSDIYRDIYIGTNVSTERCFYKVNVVPVSGTTDVQFNLQKFVVTLVQHPHSPVGSGAGI